MCGKKEELCFVTGVMGRFLCITTAQIPILAPGVFELLWKCKYSQKFIKYLSVFVVLYVYLMDTSSLKIWGCSGFDGLSTIAGCMSRMSNGSRNNIHYGTKVIDNNYSYRLAA